MNIIYKLIIAYVNGQLFTYKFIATLHLY